MTHTKGKWETYSYYDLDDREWFCVRSNRGKYICEETTEGDANLMASAPEMLEMLKYTLRYFQDSTNVEGLEMYENLIAKAEGEK